MNDLTHLTHLQPTHLRLTAGMSRWRWVKVAAAISGLWSWTVTPSLAQVVPDNTLGAESSVVQQVDALTQYIEGGAVRGSNLFHSFEQLSVAAGNALYFNPDAGIESILSRVTGSNPSHIFGRLGVVGNADLFLLNPHGFVFGADATLDVNGAFHAIAAPALPLGNGAFSAVDPQSSSLLTVSPDVSLFNYLTSGDITSTAQLQAGEDLTLAADNLQLQGRLVAGEDLHLLATETVTLRDTASAAFVASSGNDLTVQGNQLVDIFALNHPDSGLFAFGDLVLRSDAPIIGDAHFFSGGNWYIARLDGTVGSLISPNDPIILAGGNVQLGTYRGASLHILAGGSVMLDGDITIEGTGPIASTINPSNTTVINNNGLTYADLASFQVPAYDVIVNLDGTVSQVPVQRTISIDGSTEATLDVRAGVDWAALGGLTTDPAVAGVVTPTYPTNDLGSAITITGDVRIAQPDGRAVLTNQFQPNSSLIAGAIETGTIDARTGSRVVGTNGSNIALYSRDNIETGNLLSSFSSPFGNRGDGGTITLFAGGNITTENVESFSRFRDGGGITLSAGGNITTENVESFSRFRDGGGITLSAGGNITTENVESSLLNPFGNRGDGGTITLFAGGNITTGNVDSSSLSNSMNGGEGGKITFFAGGNITTGDLDSVSLFTDGEVEGEGITLFAGGNITTGNVDSSSFSTDGEVDGGGITLSAAGNITTGDLDSRSGSINFGGDGGEITLSATGNITTGNVDSFSSSRNGGDGGGITLSATGNITTGDLNSSSLSPLDHSGDGGAIMLSTVGGNITTGDLNSYSASVAFPRRNGISGNAGDGGTIHLRAPQGRIGGDNIQLLAFSVAQQGLAGNGGAVRLEARDQISGLQGLTLSSNGSSGDVTIQGSGNLLIQDVNLIASAQIEMPNPFDPNRTIPLDTSNFGASGNVFITSTGILTFENSEIRSDANGTRPGGRILIEGASEVNLNNSALLSDTNNIGTGGDIILRNLDRLTLNNSTITTDTAGFAPTSDAGDILIQNVGPILMQNGSLILVSAENNAQAGDITIGTDFIVAFPLGNNDIIANAVGGNGGRIDTSGTALVLNFTERDGFTVGQLRGLSTNDISASSVLAVNGEVIANFEEATSPRELPGDFLNADTLIAGSCINLENHIAGTFTIPGSGGLPHSPEDIDTSAYVIGDVQTLPIANNEPDTEDWQLGDPIVEPDTVAQLADGRLIFGRSCT